MVNKQVLKQYTSLKAEAEEVRRRISDLEEQTKRIEKGGLVVDKVMGGNGGNQPFRIEGFPYPEYSRKKTLLIARKHTLEMLEADIDNKLNEVHEFLSTIEDSITRRIVTYRVVDGLTWEEVAMRMGGSNNENNVKKTYQRYIDWYTKECCHTCPEKI